MIESNNPEINVDELMEKIKEEVAKRKTDYRPSRTQPALSISSLNNHLNHIESLLQNAESRSLTRSKLPAKYYKLPLAEKLEKFILKIFNLLFRDQREVNYNLTNAFKQSININRQLITEIEGLRSQLDERLGNVVSRTQSVDERLQNVVSRTKSVDERLGSVASRTQSVDERLGSVASRTQSVDERLKGLENHTQIIDEQIESIATIIDERLRVLEHYTHEVDERVANSIEQRLGVLEHRTHEVDERVANSVEQRLGTLEHRTQEVDERLVNSVEQRLEALEHRTQEVDERLANSVEQQLGALEHRTHKVDERLANSVEQRLEALEQRTYGVDESLGSINSHIQKLSETYLANNNYLKNDLIQQKRLIALFLEEARRRLPEPFDREQLKTFINEGKHALDAFYVAFEDKFRGSREDILNRLNVYLPLIKDAKVGTPDTPILDLGCGRGEWLELLRDSEYTSTGVDINKVMIEKCRALGLEVVEADAIAYLHSLPDNSLGAITGFHLIEHLSFETLMQLFTEVIRVLKSDGIVIFETPNPENILVGSCTFYSDPSHRNPLPSATTKFIAESVGLCQVNIMKLHPYPENQRLNGSEVAERFSDYFYGAQDYAVVGYKK